ncbi:MAG TPA: LysE family translocator [Chloroflexota bacterium]|nr:LysE family translocator [Chloroflexota bacterium]
MLPDLPTLALFMFATLMLNVTPGPDMLYVVANSVGRGQRAGVVSAFGIGAGTLVHTLAAAFGLSALLMSSSLAFDVVRYGGAAYLIYLGIRSLTGRESPIPSGRLEREGLGKIFRQGMATNVLNPKVALFFLAFLPQFVDPARGSVVVQFILLGTLFNTSGTTVNSLVAVASGYAGERLGKSPGFARTQRWFSGGVFVALGARIALTGAR